MVDELLIKFKHSISQEWEWKWDGRVEEESA